MDGNQLCCCMFGYMYLDSLIQEDSEMSLTAVHFLTHMKHLELLGTEA